MAFFSLAMAWNEGEKKMHELLHVPDHDNPTSTTLTPQAATLLQRAPLLAIGTLDSQRRPWTTLWSGQAGFSEPLDMTAGIIGTRTLVDAENDPVVEALTEGTTMGEMTQLKAPKMVAGLTIDLMTRKRVKIFGRVLVIKSENSKVEIVGDVECLDQAPNEQVQLTVITKIEQSLGNCPKYLNQYEISPTFVSSKRAIKSSSLSSEAKALICKSDMFFLSSSTTEDMDTNHRGGPSGFVRILSDTEIVYPEYSGNRLYQTLGNLQLNPRVSITFPDFENGDVVYVTGKAEILVLDAASRILPGSNLALKIKVEEVRFVQSGLPFRGVRKTPSPYNPLVRTLASEGNIKSSIAGKRLSASLVKKTSITPTVARFKFSVPEGVTYKPGQWVALDFSKEMDVGYSHMRDDDPTSLNDDFVRTFTISSTPLSEDSVEKEFEITIRKVGAVTGFLFKAHDDGYLKVPVLGVGGDFRIQKDGEKEVGFIAAGVGITPLLGQLPSLVRLGPLALRLYWTIRPADLDLVFDTLDTYPDIAAGTHLFVTGDVDLMSSRHIEALRQRITVSKRRMTDVDLSAFQGDTWYLCAAKPFRKLVLGWLDGKNVLFEDFDY